MSRGLTIIIALTWVATAHAAPPAERHWSESLVPADVTLTVGAQFPTFLIYEAPGPLLGVEVAWRLSPVTKLVANAGLGVVWATGTQRYLIPLGLGVRVFPWECGPWLQVGLGATPWVEHIGVVLPERDVSLTDTGATMTLGAKLGVNLWGWDIGVGYEHNVLPSPFYDTYDGDEALPWVGTVTAWIGIPLWSNSGSTHR